MLWKSYIDFEIEQEEYEKTRNLYRRLLQRTQHVKVCVGTQHTSCSGVCSLAGGDPGLLWLSGFVKPTVNPSSVLCLCQEEGKDVPAHTYNNRCISHGRRLFQAALFLLRSKTIAS